MTSEQQETVGEHPPFHRPSRADVVDSGDGIRLTFLATGKDTNGAYTQGEGVVMPGGGPPAHIHQREDETWYVVEGSLEMRIGDATLVARPGDYIRGPRGVVHAFRNVGEHPARLFTTIVPAGLEDFFMEVSQPIADPTAPLPPPPADLIERMIQAAPRYGLEFFPPPESGADTKPGPDAPTGAPGLQH
jgi:mannose-6-phosphate isomerase-like protein (cupin superfamily)